MKIIHIVGDSSWGGGGPIILALAGMAQEQGYSVDFLATDPVCQENAAKAGLRVVNLDVIWREIRPWKDLNGLRQLTTFLRKSNYSLVHTHTSKAGFVGRVAARMAGVPAIVHTVHGFPFHEESSFAARTAYVTLERIAARFCDRIVTVSNYHRDWALKLGIGDPTRVVSVPNGVEDTISKGGDTNRVRNALGLAPDEAFIFAAGRLSLQKGFEYLLAAVPELATKARRPFRIVIAGDGPLRDALHQRARELQCGERVQFLGFRTDVPELLAACDVVALPSLYEGMSISLLEAMSAGKPIVATSIGGNLEPTQNGVSAVIVPPKDPAALAEGLASLINDPSLAREKGLAAREAFLRSHTLRRMVEGYERIYQDLIATKLGGQVGDLLNASSVEGRG